MLRRFDKMLIKLESSCHGVNHYNMGKLPPNLSFLDFPREIRDQIYKYCTAPDPTWYPSSNIMPPKLGPMSLLRTCKSIHDEAAIVFYGDKMHVFYIGWRFHWKSSVWLYDVYTDTTTYVAPQYLRMIKSCALFLNPEIIGYSTATRKSGYLKMKASIQAFAGQLSGRHSLKKLQIFYGTPEYEAPLEYPDEMFIPTPMPTSISDSNDPDFDSLLWLAQDTRINLMEPLTDLYGIPSVSVSGTRPDIAYRFERAMSCSQMAVIPIKQVYKTRMVKVKGKRGKKQPQTYCASKYYESKLVWDTRLLGTLPPAPKLDTYR